MERIIKYFKEEEGKALVGFFGLALLILLSRHPHAIFGAQFWAEDGAYWYADAYNQGFLSSLTATSVGYFQTLSRLVAGVSLLFPLKNAPLFMNLSALSVQALPAVLIVSSRFSKLIPDIRTRFFIAILYLLMPNSGELHANITNAQWYLALAACMVYLADIGKSRASRVFDTAVTALSALSGPFIIFLAPIAFIQWWRDRVFWRKILVVIAGVGALIQVVGIFIIDSGSRVSVVPEMSLTLFSAIVEKQIFLGSVLGSRGYGILMGWGSVGELLAHLSLFGGVTLIGYALLKSKIELRIFIIFSFALFIAGILSPTIGGHDRVLDSVKNGWDILLRSSSGIRYWVMPIIAFHLTLIWSIKKSNPISIRVLSALFLVLLSYGLVREYKDLEFADLGFEGYAENFEEATPQSHVTIPLNPGGWSMTLIKK